MFHTQLLPLDDARLEHTATALANGDVLVTGGLDGEGGAQRSCVRFLVAEGVFDEAAPLPAAARRHTATLLADGRVLAVGLGEDEGFAATYDPHADAWTRVAAPALGRVEHAACRLADGSVLISGGRPAAALAAAEGPARRDIDAVADCERYDPASDSWQPAPPLTTPRRKHSMLALADGSVLCVGGKARGPSGSSVRLSSAERWSKGAAGFVALKRMPQSERDLCVLRDGRVLGHAGSLFDPKSGRFGVVEAGFRGGGPLVLLGNGRVVCVGHQGEEFFDPATSQWSPVGPARKMPQRGHTATLLPDGDILVVGGAAGRNQGAPYAALVEVDADADAAEETADDFDSAEKLLTLLVEREALELDDADEGVEPLIAPVARVLRFVEGPGNQAHALVRVLLDHDAVAELHLDDAQLRKILAQW